MWTSECAFPKATRHLSMRGATNVEPSPERSALNTPLVGVEDVVELEEVVVVEEEDDWLGGVLPAQPARTSALPRSSVARTSFIWVSVPRWSVPGPRRRPKDSPDVSYFYIVLCRLRRTCRSIAEAPYLHRGRPWSFARSR